MRKYGSLQADAEEELERQRLEAEQEARMQVDSEEDPAPDDSVEELVSEEEEEEDVVEPDDPDRFDRFSLSNSLETLMDSSFLKLVQLRKQFGLGWAGAELLNSMVEKNQVTPQAVYEKKEKALKKQDAWERSLPRSPSFPQEPDVGGDHLNLPLVAFSYLLRRFATCTRYCLVCHNQLDNKLEVLKPTVCDEKLCNYQYYCLNQGPSLEYQICHNTATVDLLLSLTYTAAAEGTLTDPLPVGMNLRVPLPTSLPVAQQTRAGIAMPGVISMLPSSGSQRPATVELQPDADGLVDFDSMGIQQMRGAVVQLIKSLPPIKAMKKHLMKPAKSGKAKRTLKSLDPSISPAAWLILRWWAFLPLYFHDI
jgi:ubiquitin-conjugating enzyme E2 Q